MLASDSLGNSTALEILDLQTFTASGNWLKSSFPDLLPTDLIVVDMWNGGASGGTWSGSSANFTGGAPGCHARLEFLAGVLASSVPVVVAAGGAAKASAAGAAESGNAGGISSFNGIEAGTAAGGGQASGNAPNKSVSAFPRIGQHDTETKAHNFAPVVGFWAGTQGQGKTGNAAGPAPANSLLGGKGGALGSPETTGLPGDTPGGGGAGATASAGSAKTSGAGARGEVRVYVIRGALTAGETMLPTSI